MNEYHINMRLSRKRLAVVLATAALFVGLAAVAAVAYLATINVVKVPLTQ